MTLEDYNAFCGSLPASHLVRQWGGAYVWKVGPKFFAMGIDQPDFLQITFKATEIGYEVMQDMPGLRPAPYLASRGMKWIQHYEAPGLSNPDLQDHIKASYDMVCAKLTKKVRAELGIEG